MTPRPARVLVVAESDVLAARIEAALRQEADLCVAVGRGRTLGRLIDEHHPAVVVLASTRARLPSAMEPLAGVLAPPPLVLLVDDPRRAWNAMARHRGVVAVLAPDAPAEQIAAAIRAAAAGLITLHPDVLQPASRRDPGDTAEARALTAREREILELLAEGLSNRTIAERLGISRFTVKFHVASILDKLGAGSRAEAVTLGMRSGLLSL